MAVLTTYFPTLPSFPGDSEHIKKCNEPKLCIRKFFPSRKCFTFDRPTNRRNLPRLEEMEEDELDPDFVEVANCFCEHVWKTSRPKTVPGGKVVTGTSKKGYYKTVG